MRTVRSAGGAFGTGSALRLVESASAARMACAIASLELLRASAGAELRLAGQPRAAVVPRISTRTGEGARLSTSGSERENMATQIIAGDSARVLAVECGPVTLCRGLFVQRWDKIGSVEVSLPVLSALTGCDYLLIVGHLLLLTIHEHC